MIRANQTLTFFLINIKYMIFKYLKPGVKDILIPGLIYTTGALSEMLQKQIEKLKNFVLVIA